MYTYSCQILTKFELSELIFKKQYSDVKFHENPTSCSLVFLCGRTDRHDEAYSQFSQFCESDLKRFPE